MKPPRVIRIKSTNSPRPIIPSHKFSSNPVTVTESRRGSKEIENYLNAKSLNSPRGESKLAMIMKNGRQIEENSRNDPSSCNISSSKRNSV